MITIQSRSSSSSSSKRSTSLSIFPWVLISFLRIGRSSSFFILPKAPVSNNFHEGYRQQLSWDGIEFKSVVLVGTSSKRQFSSSASSELFHSKKLYYSNPDDGSLLLSDETMLEYDTMYKGENDDVVPQFSSKKNTMQENEQPLVLDRGLMNSDDTGTSMFPSFPDVLDTIEAASLVAAENHLKKYDLYSSHSAPSPPSVNNEEIDFVSMLRSSASQLSSHRTKYVVFHISGDLIKKSNHYECAKVINDIAISRQLGAKPIIVAGCSSSSHITSNCIHHTHCGDNEYNNNDENNNLSSSTTRIQSQQNLHLSSSYLSFTNYDPNEDYHRMNDTFSDCIEDGMKEMDYSQITITDYETLNRIKAEVGMIRFELEHQLATAFRIHGLSMKNDYMSFTAEDENDDEDEEEGGNVISGTFYSTLPYGIINGIDCQYTGYPRRFQVEKMKKILDSDDVVLLTSLGSTPTGETYKVNSKHLAKCLGEVLDASEVVFCSEEEEEVEEYEYQSNWVRQASELKGLEII